MFINEIFYWEDYMKAKLTLNGKEYEVELTENQVSEIESTNKLKTGFGYDGFGNEWYVSDLLTDNEDEPIFSNEKLCKDYTRAVNLFLRMSKFQAQYDCSVKENAPYAYSFNFNKSTNDFYVYETTFPYYKFMEISFSSPEAAEQAINTFKDELMWYFTEFKPRLDM